MKTNPIKRNILIATVLGIIVTIIFSIYLTPSFGVISAIITLLIFWCFIIVPVYIPKHDNDYDEELIKYCVNLKAGCLKTMCYKCSLYETNYSNLHNDEYNHS
jgi:O-antigen/teichoic acid export membrane protein